MGRLVSVRDGQLMPGRASPGHSHSVEKNSDPSPFLWFPRHLDATHVKSPCGIGYGEAGSPRPPQPSWNLHPPDLPPQAARGGQRRPRLCYPVMALGAPGAKTTARPPPPRTRCGDCLLCRGTESYCTAGNTKHP